MRHERSNVKQLKKARIIRKGKEIGREDMCYE